MIKEIILFILFFAFFYDLKISEPILTVRFFMGILGAVLFFIDMTQAKVSFKKKYWSIILVYSLLLIWNYISCIYNNSDEFQYLYELKFLVIIFFAAYFLINISRKSIKSVSQLFDLIILMALVQCAIAVIATISDSFHAFVLANSNALEGFLEREQGNRLIGIGSAVFFGVLPTSSMAILACIYQYFNSLRRNKTIYAIGLSVIFIITYLMARTIIFVIFPAALLFYYYSRKPGQKSSLTFLVILVVILFLFMRYAGAFFTSEMYEWAFNSFSRNSENTTVNEVYNWYALTHFDTQTLLIGDARLTDGQGGYYMHIDAGYLRAIYNVGIIGVILYFYYQFAIAKMIYKTTNNENLRFLILSYFFFYFFIMLKGYNSISKELLFLLVMIDYGRLRINEFKISR